MSSSVAAAEVMRRAKRGMIRAAAELSWRDRGEDHHRVNCIIPKEWWELTTDADFDYAPFWTTGGLTFDRTVGDGAYRRRFSVEGFDLRFEPDGIELIPGARLAAPAPAPTLYTDLYPQADPKALAALVEEVRELRANAAAKVPHSGGRPSKPWWDDLWAAMAIAMYSGDLQPQRQADIERAMSDWIERNGHQATEATIRPRAKALWRAWEIEKAKN